VKISQFFASRRVVWAAYGLLAVLASVQRLAFGFDAKGFSRYENYRIFRYSWYHLAANQNPYASHPETWDLYKYSPFFAVCMAPFHALPDAVGLVLWNLCNALPLLAAILALPGFTEQKRLWMAWFVLPELLISLQNSQSNGLVAALFLGSYVALEKRESLRAAAWVMGGAFIKIFGGVAAFLAVFYPRQWKRIAVGLAMWGAFMALSPALVTGGPQLLQVYRWWWELLRNDHADSLGISVAGWLHAWFGYAGSTTLLTAASLAVMSVATVWQAWQRKSPVPALAAWLIWVVIFNHKAESPTFIIAMCGAALWYLLLDTPTWKEKALIGATLLFASIAPTDLFPRVIYKEWIRPFAVKAVPFTVIWAVLMVGMFSREPGVRSDAGGRTPPR
jgi:hypothetical protein